MGPFPSVPIIIPGRTLIGPGTSTRSFPRDEIILCLDAAHAGLGGDSCGPATLEQYRVHAQPEMCFSYSLRPLPGTCSSVLWLHVNPTRLCWPPE